jgi:hypothetical protein
MKTPEAIMGIALVVLVFLLFTSPRQRAPVYDASDEVAVQGCGSPKRCAYIATTSST